MNTHQAIDVADYRIPDDATDEQVADLLTDPLVRICNLYWIKNAEGVETKFVPNWAQCVVLYELFINHEQRLAVPKARQLGITTLAAIIALDTSLFTNDTNCSIVDKTHDDAANKLKMVKYAYDRLPQELRDALTEDNQSALGWANDSAVYAGKNARGATNQYVHVSEFGIIAFNDPKRAEEILTGAVPSASGESAIVIFESTHKGGKGGAWYDLVTDALTVSPEHRTKIDYKVLFFGWYLEPRYTLEGDVSQIPPKVVKYLDDLETQLGIELSGGQRLWYFKKKVSLKRMIYSEYPSTIEECWRAPFPGAIYASDVDKARGDGRINNMVLHYDALPVYTAWDIGAPWNTKVWFFQVVGDRINLLLSLTGGDDCNHAGAWAKRIKALPFNYGGHFLPHDAAVDYQGQLIRAGLDHTVCMARNINEWDNINQGLASIARCAFNLDGCEGGIDALDAFRSKEESDGQSVRNVPVHDWASHFSTAFGYIHQAIKGGYLTDRSAIPAKPKTGLNPQAKTGIRSNHGAINRPRARAPRSIR